MESQKDLVVDKEPLREILQSYGQVRSGDLIPLLQNIQKVYGYLPPKILTELSQQTRIPISRIYGVATFYEQFSLHPHGRNIIKCCRGTACHVNGGPTVIQAISELLKIEPGQTTQDLCFTFETVACLGTCFLAPVMMVNADYYGHLDQEKIKKILASYT